MKTVASRFSIFPRTTAWAALLCLAGVLSYTDTRAQFREHPIVGSSSKEDISKPSPTARIKSNHLPITLPFWDDFSFTKALDPSDPSSGFPLDSLWRESKNVRINDGVGILPPSRNVASFDGLDSDGNVYDNDPNAIGIRDSLTSQPINLGLSGVSNGERTSVYLSFFYQWKGYGEAPDKSDYIRIDFFNASGEWINVATIQTVDGMDETVFYDTMIQVSGEQFFHENFQFRFRNFGRLAGRFDNWNVDYVYLNKGRSSSETDFDDGALGSSVGPIFGKYFSIPINHVSANSFSPFQFDVANLRGDDGLPDPYAYRTTGIFTNYSAGTPTTNTLLLTPEDRPIKEGNPLLAPFERYRATTLVADVPASSYIAGPDSADVKMKLEFLANDDGFYTVNDTISKVYKLRNYYAYDDGDAEYSVELVEPDDRVAVGFTLPEGVEDDLTAIDVYIPGYTLSGFTTGTFFVMSASEGLPNEVISSITQVIRRKETESFHRISLLSPIKVSGRFFVGWSGSFSSKIFVGLDKSSNSGDEVYVNPYGFWQPNTTLKGNIMIRPVFGVPGEVTGIENKSISLGIYPNPSSGSFYITGRPDAIEILSLSGAHQKFTTTEEDESLRVTVQATPGLYVVRLKKDSAISVRKIVIR
jgi:hypothetical protein